MHHGETEREAEHRAARADEDALIAETRRHLPRRRAERAEQTDLASLAHHRDEERRGHRKRRHHDDEEQQEKDHVFLQLEHEEKLLVGVHPRARHAVHREGAVDLARHPVRVRAVGEFHVHAVHRAPEPVELLHGAQGHDDHAAVELLVPDLEDAADLELARQQDLVGLKFFQQERRINRHLAAQPRAERDRELRAEDHAVVVERVEGAGDDILRQRHHVLHPLHVHALDGGKRGFVLVLQEHHALGEGSRGEHALHVLHRAHHRPRVVHQAEGAHLHLALGIDDHVADLAAKAAHDRNRHDQERDSQRHPEDGDEGEKREPPPGREQLFQREVERPRHGEKAESGKS